MTIYCTYRQNGQLKRGILSQKQYEAYSKDVSITNLQVHATQHLMEQFYNQVQGINKPVKQLLYS